MVMVLILFHDRPDGIKIKSVKIKLEALSLLWEMDREHHS